DIVGRARAAQPNFNYSAAMKAKGGTWTVDELNKFLTKPSAYIPGTLMTFAGLPRENQRADVIAFLNTLSDHPKAPRRNRRRLSRARNRIGSPNCCGRFGHGRAVRYPSRRRFRASRTRM